MAKYTITIKNLIKNNFNFGLISYPIFDENYRSVLNNKILNHYYENEIGFETPELFKFYLNNKLNEIMPYYNTIYSKQLELLENITGNVNLKEIYESTSTSKSDSNSESSSSSKGGSKNLFLDTPQGDEYKGTINDTNYATNVTFDDNNSTSNINDSSSSSSNGTNNYIKTIVGNNGGRYNIDILKDLKDNLLNIDMLIINDLNELFMQIF